MSEFSISNLDFYSPTSIELLGPDYNKLITNIKNSFELINRITKHKFERPNSNQQITRIIDEIQYWSDGEELEILVDKSHDVEIDTISNCIDAFLELKILKKFFNHIISSTKKDFSIEDTIEKMRIYITHIDINIEEEFDRESWDHLYLIGKTPEEIQKHNSLRERERIFELKEKEYLSNITERELLLKKKEESLKKSLQEFIKNI
jgi:hypothetical protein